MVFQLSNYDDQRQVDSAIEGREGDPNAEESTYYLFREPSRAQFLDNRQIGRLIELHFGILVGFHLFVALLCTSRLVSGVPSDFPRDGREPSTDVSDGHPDFQINLYFNLLGYGKTGVAMGFLRSCLGVAIHQIINS